MENIETNMLAFKLAHYCFINAKYDTCDAIINFLCSNMTSNIATFKHLTGKDKSITFGFMAFIIFQLCLPKMDVD